MNKVIYHTNISSVDYNIIINRKTENAMDKKFHYK